MGSGRDKRKKQKGKQPGLGATKTEKKTALNATKEQRRAESKAAVRSPVQSQTTRKLVSGFPGIKTRVKCTKRCMRRLLW